jgi:hypothetical protein
MYFNHLCALLGIKYYANPVTGCGGRPVWLWDVEDPTLSRQLTDSGEVVSLTHLMNAKKKTMAVVFSLEVNYTKGAAAAFWQSWCQFQLLMGAALSAQWDPMIVHLSCRGKGLKKYSEFKGVDS